MRHRRSDRPLGIVLALALALASVTGCGDDSGGGNNAPSVDGSVPADGSVSPDGGVSPDSGPVTDPHTCADPRPEWVFCSDFEEGDKSVWDDYDGNPDDTNLLLADGGPFGLTGNTVMRLRVPAGRGGADLVKVLPSAHDQLYARWYVYYEPGFDFSAPNHGGGLHAGDRNLLGRSDFRPTGDDWFSAWLEHTTGPHHHYAYVYYRGMYQDCVDPQGSCWGDHFPCTADDGSNYCEKPQHRETALPPTLETGRWYCLEMMLDGGTAVSRDGDADGQLNFWVDGQAQGPWTDLWFRTTSELQISILWLSLFHHDTHSVEGLYLDDVVVSTERVGCL